MALTPFKVLLIALEVFRVVAVSRNIEVLCPGKNVSLNCSHEPPRSGITWRIWCQCSADTSGTCGDICTMPETIVDTGDPSLQGTVCELLNYSVTFTAIEENGNILVPSSVLDIAAPLDFHQENATTLCVECQRQFSRQLIVVPDTPFILNNLITLSDYATSNENSTEVTLMWLPASIVSELGIEYTVIISELNTSTILYNNITSFANFTARLEFNTNYSITLYASTCNHTLISQPFITNISVEEDLPHNYENQSSQDMLKTTTMFVTLSTTSNMRTVENNNIVIVTSITAGVFLLIACALGGCFIVVLRQYCGLTVKRKANSQRSEGAVENASVHQSGGVSNPENCSEGEYNVLNYKERKWKALGGNASKQCKTDVLGEYKMITLENIGDEPTEAQYSEVTHRTAVHPSVQIAASTEAEYFELGDHAVHPVVTERDTDPCDTAHTMYSQVDKTDDKKDSSKIGTLDLDKLVGALRKRSDLWHGLASALEIPEEQVEVIEGHCQNDFDCLVEVCDAWLNKRKEESKLPTWQAVISALEEAGANEFADELKKGLTKGEEIVDEVIENEDAAPPIPPQLF